MTEKSVSKLEQIKQIHDSALGTEDPTKSYDFVGFFIFQCYLLKICDIC